MPTSRTSPTACGPSASRASRSTSPTASSPRRGARSSSPTRRATSATRATWSPARRPPTSRSMLVDARRGLVEPVAPPRLPRRAARHPPPRGVREQDGPRRLRPRAASGRSRRDFAALGERLGVLDAARRADQRAGGRQRGRAVARARPGTTAPPLLELLETVEVERDRNLDQVRFPVQWIVRGERLPRLRGPGGRRRAARRATRSSCCRTARARGSRRIDTPRGPVERAFPPMVGDASSSRTSSTSARGDLLAGAGRRAGGRRASSRRRSAGWSRRRLRAGAALPAQAHDAPGAGDARVDRRARRRRVAGAPPTPATLALNDIGRVRLRTSAPVVADPYADEPGDGRVHPHRRAHARHRGRGDGARRARTGRRRRAPAARPTCAGTRARWSATTRWSRARPARARPSG